MTEYDSSQRSKRMILSVTKNIIRTAAPEHPLVERKLGAFICEHF